jgi:hypothetical protein
MDPLSILILTVIWAGVSAGIYAIVYFANLTFQIIAGWFKQFAYLMGEYDVGFTVRKAMADGNVVYVQGIFNTSNDKVKEARVIKPSSVDSEVERLHNYGRKEVAIYTQ